MRRFFQKHMPGSTLINARVLHGGISAEMMLCELLAVNGSVEKLILRQPNQHMLAHPAQSARDEFMLLQHLQGLPIGSPVPVLFDESGEFFSSPVLLIRYIEGEMDFSLRNASNLAYQMGKRLAAIHQVNAVQEALSFLPTAPLDLEMSFGGWPPKSNQLPVDLDLRGRLKACWPFHHPNPAVLLHGDYWPGNILWLRSQLAGVVDWEDAMLGEPLIDLSICRLDLMCLFSREAVRIFTDAYLAHRTVDTTDLPGWDLIAALRLARLAGSDLTGWCSFFIPYGRGDFTPAVMKESFAVFAAESQARFMAQ